MWREFEREIKRILEYHNFKTKHRFIFKDEIGKAEVDVIAERFDIILAIDAKRYTQSWFRKSAIKREAKKHLKRCERLEKIYKRKVIPIIVLFIDDNIYIYKNCIIIPFEKLNDFLINVHYYLAEFGLA